MLESSSVEPFGDFKLNKFRIDDPFYRDSGGKFYPIGVIFLGKDNSHCITAPATHSMIRLAGGNILLKNCKNIENEISACLHDETVDIFVLNDCVYIRPDPENFDAVERADSFLRKLGLQGHRIRYQEVSPGPVRDILKKRGECYRFHESPIVAETYLDSPLKYYYALTTGCRALTYEQFSRISGMSHDDLRISMIEIAGLASRKNKFGNPELIFFMAPGFYENSMKGLVPENLDYEDLKKKYAEIDESFKLLVSEEYRLDNWREIGWRRELLCELLRRYDDSCLEEAVLGLSSEFHQILTWLPAGSVSKGSFIPDPLLDEDDGGEQDAPCVIRDLLVPQMAMNYFSEFPDIEYINLARVERSLSERVPMPGRRQVYIAVFKRSSEDTESVRHIRVQKWDACYYLDQGRNLDDALDSAAAYTRDVLARNEACRAMLMNIHHFKRYSLFEKYQGDNAAAIGRMIETSYFDRPYIFGTATDKISASSYARDGFIEALALLLGSAAASNLVIGRVFNGSLLFDDGDEIIALNESGLPVSLLVTDVTSALNDFGSDLSVLASGYGKVIERRRSMLGTRAAEVFIDGFISSFKERFEILIKSFRADRICYNSLLAGRAGDALETRWKRCLLRLDLADLKKITKAIEDSMR